MTDHGMVSIVIPTIGRESLKRLLSVLAVQGAASGEGMPHIVVVDDRFKPSAPLPLPGGMPVRVLRSGGRGPAAARNIGWRSVRTPWVAFLDDDVVPEAGWLAALDADLLSADAWGAVGSQGGIVVPRAPGRPPTDDERRTQALADARWITADMAYRRDVLVEIGGFDERFPRAYREDSDLALRVIQAGHHISRGRRVCTHPVAPATWTAGVRAQIGNRDNALMRRKHGRQWRRLIGEGPGRLPSHTATAAAATLALAGALARNRRMAAFFAVGWAWLTGEFAAQRFLAGPRTARELARMAATSILIPPAAVAHRLAGQWAHRGARRDPPLAVLLDRDDTLIADGPYLNDPAGVRPLPGVARALQRLRDRGLLLAVVTNQSGVAQGRISAEQLAAVNDRVESMLGRFQSWQICEHDATAGCGCRKPKPGMVIAAADALGVDPGRCVVIGDTGADMDAALSARARAVLVPTARTLPEEIAEAGRRASVAATLGGAVAMVLKECR